MSQFREWFFVTPDGRHIVTRYYEPTEDDAWRTAAYSINQTIAERDAKIRGYKAAGFTMSLTPPPPPRPKQIMVMAGLHLQDGR